MRSSHLKQTESQVSVEVTQVSEAYHELLNRSNRLADRFLRVGSKSKDYNDAMERAKRWLKETEPKVSKICSEPIGAEPRVVEDQLNRAKALNNEIIANREVFKISHLNLPFRVAICHNNRTFCKLCTTSVYLHL